MRRKYKLYDIFQHSIALTAHKFGKVYQFNYNYKILLISKLTLFVFLNNSDTWTFLRFISNLFQSLIFRKSGVILP